MGSLLYRIKSCFRERAAPFIIYRYISSHKGFQRIPDLLRVIESKAAGFSAFFAGHTSSAGKQIHSDGIVRLPVFIISYRLAVNAADSERIFSLLIGYGRGVFLCIIADPAA